MVICLLVVSSDVSWFDVDIKKILFNFNLKTAEIVGSVFYGRNFTVFRNSFCSRLVF